MKVLITGGAGYIGSALTKALNKEGDTVYNLDVRPLPHGIKAKKHIIQSLSDYEGLKEKLQSLEMDVIAHLAAMVSGAPHDILNTNVDGTANLLEALRFSKPSIVIVASTAAQLYRNAQYIPIDEQHPVTPVTVYGLSKHLTEEIVQFYYRVHSLPTVIFRQTNVYGFAPIQKYTVINRFLKDALTKGRITIDGDGKQVRNFIHVSDLVKYWVEAIHYPSPERLAGQVFNIAGPEECQINILAQMIVSLVESKTGRKIDIVNGPPSIPAEKDIHIFNISSRKAQLIFNFRPEVGLTNGVEKTYNEMHTHDGEE